MKLGSDRTPAMRNWSPALSIVVPVHNEEGNLVPLWEAITAALEGEFAFEIVLVDDGSLDGSFEEMRALVERDEHVRAIRLAERRGQSIAFGAGFEAARNEVVITMDADLQNDPADIPALIEGLTRADVAVGWRRDRHDNWLRRVSSRIANGVRNRLTRESIRDTGCSLKAFRRDQVRRLKIFDGMHRFLPTLMRYEGFSVVEIPVRHHPRRHGATKYGLWNRVFRSTRDLFAVRWMCSRYPRYRIEEELP